LVIFFDINNHETQWPGVLIGQKFNQASHIRCTNDSKRCGTESKLISHIPAPIIGGNVAVCLESFHVSEVNWIVFEVPLTWEICQKNLNTFGNLAVV
jgi:hypothetical protein